MAGPTAILTGEGSDASPGVYVWGQTGYSLPEQQEPQPPSNGGGGSDEAQPKSPSIVAPYLLESAANLPAVQISCGTDFAAAVTESGQVYTWGKGMHGKLGHGNENDLSKPTPVEALAGRTVTRVQCGAYHMGALTDDGLLFTWGWDRYGQLGHSGDVEQHTPKCVEILKDEGVKTFDCCDTYTIAVTALGSVFTWGSGEFGRLGFGDTRMVMEPKHLDSLSGIVVRKVSCGKYHAAVLTDTNDVYTWGYGSYGQLGLGDVGFNQRTPARVEALKSQGVRDVACGMNHTVAVTVSGEVYCWGGGGDGQLGLGDKKRQSVPVKVDLLASQRIVQIAAGTRFSAAVTTGGHLFTWGHGNGGQLGHGNEDDRKLPRPVEYFEGKQVVSISCYGSMAAIVRSPGTIVEPTPQLRAPNSPRKVPQVTAPPMPDLDLDEQHSDVVSKLREMEQAVAQLRQENQELMAQSNSLKEEKDDYESKVRKMEEKLAEAEAADQSSAASPLSSRSISPSPAPVVGAGAPPPSGAGSDGVGAAAPQQRGQTEDAQGNATTQGEDGKGEEEKKGGSTVGLVVMILSIVMLSVAIIVPLVYPPAMDSLNGAISDVEKYFSSMAPEEWNEENRPKPPPVY